MWQLDKVATELQPTKETEKETYKRDLEKGLMQKKRDPGGEMRGLGEGERRDFASLKGGSRFKV